MQQDKQGNDHHDKLSDEIIDLALLLQSDFHIGTTSIHQRKSKKPFWVEYLLDGQIRDQTLLSARSWRALMLLAIIDRRHLSILEMDEPKRLKQMLPPEIMQKLAENAKLGGDIRPVVKLYHPASNAAVIITRSRCKGHAVDALHNLSSIGPLFQPVWISDLMRLNAMIGLRLVRDSSFGASLPISAYLEAAAKAGRLIDEPELLGFTITGQVVPLPSPEPTLLVQKMFDAQCRKWPALEELRGRKIQADYGFDKPKLGADR
jgi:hypothetical protein